MPTPNYITKSNKNKDNCKDNIVFYSKLACKLLVMSETINERIKTITSQICSKNETGVLLASIEAPVMTIAIKYEYIEYIKQYGPPCNGIFDEDKLNQIRTTLQITNSDCL
jgi:hypothetical protein